MSFVSLDPGIPPFKAGFPGSFFHDVSPVGFVSRPYGAQFLGAKSLWRFGVGMLQRAPNLPSGRCGSQGGNLWGIPQREVTWMRRFVFRFCEDDSIMPFPCFSWWEIFSFLLVYIHVRDAMRGIEFGSEWTKGIYVIKKALLTCPSWLSVKNQGCTCHEGSRISAKIPGKGTIPFWQIGIARLKLV